jgi:S1-C subfamily serine protease
MKRSSKKSKFQVCDSIFIRCKDHLDFLLKAIVISCLATAFCIFIIKAPEQHGAWLRSKVGSRTYIIRDGELSGQGTGFAIKAPSGVSYVMTNDHVCEVSRDGINISVFNANGDEMRRRILQRSKYSDLCLIEGMPGVEGLELGSPAKIGQIIASLGHPAGYALTLSRGEVIMQQDVPIAVGPISVVNPFTGEEELIPKNKGGVPIEECRMPKSAQMDISESFFGLIFKIKLCVNVTKQASFTNMVIQPGSSGSAVVNFFGNVVGVVFAGDRAGWGVFVSYKDVADLLKQY